MILLRLVTAVRHELCHVHHDCFFFSSIEYTTAALTERPCGVGDRRADGAADPLGGGAGVGRSEAEQTVGPGAPRSRRRLLRAGVSGGAGPRPHR